MIVHIQEMREFVRQYKKDHPRCSECKCVFNYWILQFDHINPKNKLNNVSELVRRGCAIEIIKAEIEKCEIVCGNCHADREHRRGTNL